MEGLIVLDICSTLHMGYSSFINTFYPSITRTIHDLNENLSMSWSFKNRPFTDTQRRWIEAPFWPFTD